MYWQQLGATLALLDWERVIRLIVLLTYHAVVACTIHEIARAAAC